MREQDCPQVLRSLGGETKGKQARSLESQDIIAVMGDGMVTTSYHPYLSLKRVQDFMALQAGLGYQT